VTAAPSATRAGTGSIAGTTYAIPIDVAYQADIWGSIRRTVAANSALAQASAAQLENARLSYQAELAADYFQIQGLDAERQLLVVTVTSYEQYLQLTQDRFDGGVASMGDVAQARTQLETVRAQLADLGIARAQFAHAIAVLTGRPPSALAIPSSASQVPPPPLPSGLPSNLLERRPDIAAAERQVVAANQQIGVAKAAYFPALTLGGSAGSQAAAIVNLLTVPTRVWSVGAQLAATLFDGGKIRAQVRVSEAAYDATVAGYRQSVLTALQQVEDSLVELRILAEEATIVTRAIAAAQQSLDISTIQYRGGLTNYLQVITAQTSLLQNQRAAVDLLTRRMLASVALIQSLGGGWDVTQLPSANDVRQ
jgi:NodT family efflux transporter outer membrane factor (OMF) lipoprotein